MVGWVADGDSMGGLLDSMLGHSMDDRLRHNHSLALVHMIGNMDLLLGRLGNVARESPLLKPS